MGATGPCGPCSEIHYDHVGGRNAASLVNMDDFSVVEIWNNVFIQFNREADGSLKVLPAQHVDTGMGFERLVAALNGTRSNYDTDVFSPIFKKIQETARLGDRSYQGKFGDEDKEGIDTAYRVIADHVRTLTFALSDGGVPSNTGRGYVLRRILRRGARYARKKLGVELGSFFSSIVPSVVESQGDFFPEITKRLDDVKELLDEEERSFARTLDRGEKLFDQYAKQALDEKKTELNGTDVWRLYDTYGFPVDLTRLMAEELGLGVNDEEFEKAQAHSKEMSKGGAKKGAKDTVKLDVHDIAALEKNDDVPKTDDSFKYGNRHSSHRSYGLSTETLASAFFTGSGAVNSVIKAFYHEKAFPTSTSDIPSNATFGIILDRTGFYAESGGQEYDQGSIVIDGIAEFEVENVQSFNGYVVHIGQMKYGKLSLGDEVFSAYDEVPNPFSQQRFQGLTSSR